MSRLADSLVVGFSIRPEWNPEELLHPCQIEVEHIISRQVYQVAGMEAIVAKVHRVIQEELGTQHIMLFQEKLLQVMPGPGHSIDKPTHHITSQNIHLMPSQTSSSSLPITPAHPIVPLSISLSQLPTESVLGAPNGATGTH